MTTQSDLLDMLTRGLGIIDSSRGGNTTGIPLNKNEQDVDISETEDTLFVYTTIPGIKKEDIKIDFYNNKITIAGDRVKPYPIDTTYFCNTKYGSFIREVLLPISVTSPQSVTTTYENGVLIIAIDKKIEERNMFSLNLQP